MEWEESKDSSHFLGRKLLSKKEEKVMVITHKSSENKDKAVRIEEFFCTERVEERRKYAVRIWESIVEKVSQRRMETWKEAA